MPRLATIAALLVAAAVAQNQREVHARNTHRTLVFDVASAPYVHRRSLSPELELVAKADLDPQGRVFGWSLEVRKRNARRPDNLLYGSRFWHGPQPSQFDAWTVAAGYWPNRRDLPVRSRRLVVTAECRDCRTRGTGPNVTFTHGTLAVGWHKT
ncbi:MAG TPA: hypothetical protein VE989_08990 [Sphingomicrobium sp.]|nr:hypothetical protein [Sphingomicrobium sp.]